jgi:hypothetical protein
VSQTAPAFFNLYVEYAPDMAVPAEVQGHTCVACKHFQPVGARCSQFGTFNVVTGETAAAPASFARGSPNKCGTFGTFFAARDAGEAEAEAGPKPVREDADGPTPYDEEFAGLEDCDGGGEAYECYSPDGFYWLNCNHPPPSPPQTPAARTAPAARAA